MSLYHVAKRQDQTMDLVACKGSKVVVTMEHTAKVERGSVWTISRPQLDVHLK